MNKIKFVYWQDENIWLGYLYEYPDYMTQGESLDELKENLKDIYNDIISNAVPYIRKIAEMEVA
ncbi:MAG: type II toxin-antitoxin system HicB family antitoxin [Deltaproteobacteria bacterium]|jgi:predicted RNase H-like HicB family nuclease|nr:type II toxin-antitoxin system HicB family antitoxin [Deltaproteobacteria bacterium]